MAKDVDNSTNNMETVKTVEKPQNNAKTPKISLLVLNCNSLPLLHLCLESFHQMASDRQNIEYVVATHKSDELNDLDRSNLKVVNVRENAGYTEAYNEAAKVAVGDLLWVLNDNYLCLTKNFDTILLDVFTQHNDKIAYVMVDDNLHNKLGAMYEYGCTAPVFGRGGYEKQGEIFPKKVRGGGAETAEYRLYQKHAPECILDLSSSISLAFIDREKWVGEVGPSELTDEEMNAVVLKG